MNESDIRALERRSRDLEDKCSGEGSIVSSNLSEERDRLLHEGSRIVEDLERTSNVSLHSDKNTNLHSVHSGRQSPRSHLSQASSRGSERSADRKSPVAQNLSSEELTSLRLRRSTWVCCVDGVDGGIENARITFEAGNKVVGDLNGFQRWSVSGPLEVTIDDGVGRGKHVLSINREFSGFTCPTGRLSGRLVGKRLSSLQGAGGRHLGASAFGSQSHSQNSSSEDGGSNRRSTPAPSAGSSSVWATLTAGQESMVKDMLGASAAEHGADIDKIHAEFAASESRETSQRLDNAEQSHKVAELSELLENKEAVQALLLSSRNNNTKLTDERDDLTDQMTGMEAMHAAKIERLLQSVVDLKAAHVHANEEKDVARSELATENTSKVSGLVQEIAAFQAATRDAESELAMIVENSSQNETEESRKLAALQALLDSNNREIARRAKEDLTRGRSLTVKEKADDASKLASVEDLLAGGREREASLNATIHEELLEAAAMKEDHRKEVEDLMRLLAAAKNVVPNPKAKAKGRVQKTGLASISEFSDPTEGYPPAESSIPAAETTASAINLKLIEILRAELATAHAAQDDMRDEAIGKKAKTDSEIARYLKHMADSRLEHAEHIENIALIRRAGNANAKEQEDKIQCLEESMAALTTAKAKDENMARQKLEDEAGIHISDLENLQERLAVADEHKRNMILLLSETQRELDVQLTKHSHLLKRRNATSADEDEPTDAVRLQEDRNTLENTLEIQKITYEALYDDIQGRISAEAAKHETIKSDIKKELETKHELQATLDRHRALLSVGSGSADPDSLSNSETRKAGELTSCVEGATDTSASLLSLFSLLRCPTRLTMVRRPSHLWQVLTAMRSMIALLCKPESLEIVDVSKGACTMWSVSELWGSAMLSLLCKDAQKDWFRKKVLSTVQGSASYVCVIGLLTKDNAQRDFNVQCARVTHNAALALVLVFEIQSGPGAVG